jgi:hypothetical protein
MPRTYWSGEGSAGMTHFAGWICIALVLGIVAIASLVLSRLRRAGVASAIFSAMAASSGSVAAAAAAHCHWLDQMSGSL